MCYPWATTRPSTILLEAREAGPAPLLSACGVMSWRAVLLEDRVLYLREWLEWCLPLHRQPWRRRQDLFHVVLGRHSLAAGEDVRL